MLGFKDFLGTELLTESGRAAEDRHFAVLRKQIRGAVSANGGPITLKIGKRKYKNVHKVVQLRGNPKADFALVDHNGEHIGFISHKHGEGESDFQQLGGTSHLPNDHPEVAKLAGHIRNNRFKTGTHAVKLSAKNARHADLINKAVWGMEHGSPKSSIENVDHLIQGDTTVTRQKDGSHKLEAAHVYDRGDELPYKFVMLARPGSGRRIGDVKGFRGQISTEGARKIDSFVPRGTK